VHRWIREQADRNGLSVRTTWLVLVGPPLLFALLAVLAVLPPTRDVTRWQLLDENRPAELLTFVTLFAASVLGARAAWHLRAAVDGRLWQVFYGLATVGLFVVAMEEIAWGQWFLGFDTPAALADLNAQGETTLHNLGPLQGRNELFRLAFGVAGLLGLLAHRVARLRRVAVPLVLAPTILTILVHAVVDLATASRTLSESAAITNGMLSEITEMLIGLAAVAYLWLTTVWAPAGSDLAEAPAASSPATRASPAASA
jgi:hypothetical protein